MKPLIRGYKGKRPILSTQCFIAETAAVIGDVEIQDEASIWYGVTLRGDCNAIKIGRRANIQDGTVVHVDFPDNRSCIIGEGVTIGHGCIIHACDLNDYCFVGMGSTILDGAEIKTEGMLAAHSLLPPGKVIQSREIWAGVPAKLWREIKSNELELIYSTQNIYWETAQKFLEEMDPNYLKEWIA